MCFHLYYFSQSQLSVFVLSYVTYWEDNFKEKTNITVFYLYIEFKGKKTLPTFSWIIDNFSISGFPGGSAGKESACSVGDICSVPGLGRSPGEGKGYALQYSGLENSMDCTVLWVAKSWTWLQLMLFRHIKGEKMCHQRIIPSKVKEMEISIDME